MVFFRFPRLDLAVSAVCLALLGYFAWHAWSGPRGFQFRDSLEQKLAQLQVERDGLSTQRAALEAKVALMRPEHVDPDMLEELARSQLRMVGANDLVINLPN